jgi:hypothetical protein
MQMERRLGASSSLRSVCMSCWTVCSFLGADTILSDSLEWYLLLPSHFSCFKVPVYRRIAPHGQRCLQ